jgi:hypothetical protein
MALTTPFQMPGFDQVAMQAQEARTIEDLKQALAELARVNALAWADINQRLNNAGY